jgi:two-component system response regulator MtrA
VWHYRSPNVETRTVDIHIVGLRRKVEPDPAKPTLIQTVRGKGYRWFN